MDGCSSALSLFDDYSDDEGLLLQEDLGSGADSSVRLSAADIYSPEGSSPNACLDPDPGAGPDLALHLSGLEVSDVAQSSNLDLDSGVPPQGLKRGVGRPAGRRSHPSSQNPKERKCDKSRSDALLNALAKNRQKRWQTKEQTQPVDVDAVDLDHVNSDAKVTPEVGQEDSDPRRQEISNIASALFSSASAVLGSSKAISELLDSSSYLVRTTINRLASCALEVQNSICNAFLSKLITVGSGNRSDISQPAGPQIKNELFMRL